MPSFKIILSLVSPQWWFVFLVSALGITAVSVRAFESEESKARRAETQEAKGSPGAYGKDFILRT